MTHTDYNFIIRAGEIFNDGWKVILDSSLGNKGITNCLDKMIIMGRWDEWLWAHELTHVFMDCV